MEYVNLGKTGLKVSRLSLGSWLTFGKQIGDSTAEDLMKLAYDKGVNFFDNAEAYAGGKSEEVMGEILHKMGWSRDSYIVSSKVFFGLFRESVPTQKGLSRKHIVEACHQAMKRLRVDYLDLYFCHRPDKTVPIEETVWTMHNLIQQGKILYWGTSEWSAREIMEAHMVARQHHLMGPVMEQPQYNMLHRHRVEVEYEALYEGVGLGTTIWSPLGSGILSGKYLDSRPSDTRLEIPGLEWLKDRTLTEDKLEKVRSLNKLAREVGLSMPVMAVAWCLKNKHVSTVILGASKTSQLEETLMALEAVDKLTPEVMDNIETILQNRPEKPEFGW